MRLPKRDESVLAVEIHHDRVNKRPPDPISYFEFIESCISRHPRRVDSTGVMGAGLSSSLGWVK